MSNTHSQENSSTEKSQSNNIEESNVKQESIKEPENNINQEDNNLNNSEELEQVKTELEEARESAKESYDKMLRIQAEMENLRRRNAKDIESAHKFALEKFTKSLLEVVDSMTMGLQTTKDDTVDMATVKEGMKMTYKIMMSTLEKFEIMSINPKGEGLNPEKHEAISIIPAPDTPSNAIIEVVQVGWELNGRVIRPAMVVVAQ